jgi:16S rRNA (cytosine1402-N4)-methyltransferase
VAEQKFHIPVMLNEILSYLDLGPGKIIVDATIGTAGHSAEIIKRILPDGKLIGIDRDAESLEVARERLSDYRQYCEFVHDNFCDIEAILNQLGVTKVDGVLFDLGISSFQLDNPERGFSFQQEGPLDMRLDRSSFISAYDLINNLTQDEISSLLWSFGEERWHNRIARYLVKERENHPISTTSQLSSIVMQAIPSRYRYRHFRIHPATRTFQAVRIAVNRELETLQIAINKVFPFLREGARICVISFHSLEDRIVKLSFRKAAQERMISLLTAKPTRPMQEEISNNPSSRSAKLRIAEKT